MYSRQKVPGEFSGLVSSVAAIREVQEEEVHAQAKSRQRLCLPRLAHYYTALRFIGLQAGGTGSNLTHALV